MSVVYGEEALQCLQNYKNSGFELLLIRCTQPASVSADSLRSFVEVQQTNSAVLFSKLQNKNFNN